MLISRTPYRYDAIRTWYKLLTSPDSEYWVQLAPGTAVGKSFLDAWSQHLDHELTGNPVVDNHRVLHGRSAFNGKRRMCGAYIGMDEYRSKLAVLTEKFAPDTITQDTATSSSVNGRSIWHPAL